MNEVRPKEPYHQPYNGNHDNVPSSSSGCLEMGMYGYDSWPENRTKDVAASSRSGFGYGSSTQNFMCKVQQEYTASYEAHHAKQSESFSQAVRVEGYGGAGRSGAWVSRGCGLGFGHQDRPTSSKAFSRVYDGPSRGGSGLLPTPSLPTSILPETINEKQRLITRVSSAVLITLRNPSFMSGPDGPNYNFILSRSIQACKTNPEYIYVNLRDIPPADLPKNRKVPTDGYACELRCQCVYLATGYSGSKNGARDRASEQAVKLFMRPVEVRVLQRQYKRTCVNDMVVCQVNTPNPPLPHLFATQRTSRLLVPRASMSLTKANTGQNL